MAKSLDQPVLPFGDDAPTDEDRRLEALLGEPESPREAMGYGPVTAPPPRFVPPPPPVSRVTTPPKAESGPALPAIVIGQVFPAEVINSLGLVHTPSPGTFNGSVGYLVVRLGAGGTLVYLQGRDGLSFSVLVSRLRTTLQLVENGKS